MKIEAPKGIFIPQYDEIALFAMSLTCALLISAAAFSGNLPINLADVREIDIRFIGAVFVFFAGLLLSIYHAFTDKPKTPIEKSFMLFFAVLLNAFAGIMAGMYDLATESGLLVIFPILNIINSVILFIMFRTRVLNEASIRDEHASRSQFLLTAIAVVVLFVVCHYVMSLIWMQTLSICVAYATNISRSVPVLILRDMQEN
jgi:hypothetical protein